MLVLCELTGLEKRKRWVGKREGKKIVCPKPDQYASPTYHVHRYTAHSLMHQSIHTLMKPFVSCRIFDSVCTRITSETYSGDVMVVRARDVHYTKSFCAQRSKGHKALRQANSDRWRRKERSNLLHGQIYIKVGNNVYVILLILEIYAVAMTVTFADGGKHTAFTS